MMQFKPRSNGNGKPKWEVDDEADRLTQAIVDECDEDIPDLPEQTASGTTDEKPPEVNRAQLQNRVQPKPDVKAPPADTDARIREVAIKLVDLMTDKDVRCWVQDGVFVATRLFSKSDGKAYQQTTSIRFAGVSVKTVELIS